MSFDFAQAKATARRTVHATFGVQAFYQEDATSVPVETRARWHNAISKPYGGLVDGDGYAQIIEGIDRIVLIPVDLLGNCLTLKRGGRFTFPTMLPGVTFLLDLEEPSTGPLEVSWQVTREKDE